MKPDLTAELDRLSKIEQAATPGPWGTLERHGRDIADEGWSEVHVVGGPESEPLAATFISHTLETDNTEADTAFIITARTEMPALLAALRVVLELADTATVASYSEQGGITGTRPRPVAWTLDPAKVREVITRELTGKKAGDA